MRQCLCRCDEVVKLIEQGKRLMLAGDDAVLKKLPQGSWIGGTIPYFMAPKGTFSRDQILTSELPEYVDSVTVKIYDWQTISGIYQDSPDNGISVIIMPAQSGVLMEFALHANTFDKFASAPLVGWVSGMSLDELGTAKARVYDGIAGAAHTDKAVVMHINFAKQCAVNMGILNIFSQGDGDELVFEQNGFTAGSVLVNGERCSLTEYITANQIDTKRPLVADYYGAAINISILQVDHDKQLVTFYAPVFEGVKYRFSAPVNDYVSAFEEKMPQNLDKNLFFSCNCILNYIHSELEGKELGGVVGPFTFGEIAYQLLNQTLVYVTVES